MPDRQDRTDVERLRGLRDEDIDYSDIPPLSADVWQGRQADAPTCGPRDYVVVPCDSGWAVRTKTRKRPVSVHARQRDAVEAARGLAAAAGSSVVVEQKDGRYRSFSPRASSSLRSAPA